MHQVVLHGFRQVQGHQHPALAHVQLAQYAHPPYSRGPLESKQPKTTTFLVVIEYKAFCFGLANLVSNASCREDLPSPDLQKGTTFPLAPVPLSPLAGPLSVLSERCITFLSAQILLESDPNHISCSATSIAFAVRQPLLKTPMTANDFRASLASGKPARRPLHPSHRPLVGRERRLVPRPRPRRLAGDEGRHGRSRLPPPQRGPGQQRRLLVPRAGRTFQRPALDDEWTALVEALP